MSLTWLNRILFNAFIQILIPVWQVNIKNNIIILSRFNFFDLFINLLSIPNYNIKKWDFFINKWHFRLQIRPCIVIIQSIIQKINWKGQNYSFKQSLPLNPITIWHFEKWSKKKKYFVGYLLSSLQSRVTLAVVVNM